MPGLIIGVMRLLEKRYNLDTAGILGADRRPKDLQTFWENCAGAINEKARTAAGVKMGWGEFVGNRSITDRTKNPPFNLIILGT